MAEAAHDHSGKGDSHRHGFVLLHLNDMDTKADARNAVKKADVSAQGVDVKLEPWADGLLPVLVGDASKRGMEEFHLALDRVAAQYLSLMDPNNANYFRFEHHF